MNRPEVRLLCCLMVSVLLQTGCKEEAPADQQLFDFELQKTDGAPYAFSELRAYAGSVMLFLQPECPFCHSYARTFRQLDSLLSSQNIRLIGVVAGTNFSREEIISYLKKYRLTFPVVLDPQFALTRWIKATITPQVFLMDAQGKRLYHGMIDNWGYEIGKVRARATEFYLLDAVTAYLQQQPQPRDSTQALGCYIQ